MAQAKQEQREKLGPHPWPQRLQAARVKRDLSEEELAQRAGMCEGTIKNLEKGNGLVAKFLVVCKALGVDPADILDREVA